MKQKIVFWLAWHIPNDMVMWCFIRVMALGWEKTNKLPDEVTYKEAYDIFKKEYNLKDF